MVITGFYINWSNVFGHNQRKAEMPWIFLLFSFFFFFVGVGGGGVANNGSMIINRGLTLLQTMAHTIFSLICTPDAYWILKVLGAVLIRGRHSEYELWHKCFSRNFLKVFRTAFWESTADGMPLILSGNSLKISKTPFNPFTPGGKKGQYT